MFDYLQLAAYQVRVRVLIVADSCAEETRASAKLSWDPSCPSYHCTAAAERISQLVEPVSYQKLDSGRHALAMGVQRVPYSQ